MARTCEADLGTVLLAVTRVTNTKVVRLYSAFSSIFHGWKQNNKIWYGSEMFQDDYSHFEAMQYSP